MACDALASWAFFNVSGLHRKMATRKNMRKNTRKSRKSTKNMRTRKNQAGGKRSEWLKKVMRVYKEMKARNPKTSLGDAMKAAKKMN
jgi:hypothetical protein